jgi:hypothetical protein
MGHIMKCIKPQGYILEKKKIVVFNFKRFFLKNNNKKKKNIWVADLATPFWPLGVVRPPPKMALRVAGLPQILFIIYI